MYIYQSVTIYFSIHDARADMLDDTVNRSSEVRQQAEFVGRRPAAYQTHNVFISYG